MAVARKQFCYNTSFAETDSYEIKWQIVNYDVVFSKFVLYEYDPSLQPVERITPKTLNWRLKIFFPNEGNQGDGTLIKSDEIGYMVMGSETEGQRSFTARVNMTMYSVNAEEEKLLCTDHFCQKNTINDETQEFSFDIRVLPFDHSVQIRNLLMKVVIDVYADPICDHGFEKPCYTLGPSKILAIETERDKLKSEIRSEFKILKKYFPKLYEIPTCDLKIESMDEETFNFHRDLLKIQSPVFKAMLDVPMVESRENMIRIENFTSLVIEGFHSYLYEGYVRNIAICPDEFHKFGHHYDLDNIRKLAELEMRSQISQQTWSKFHNLTVIFDDLKDLESDLKEYFLSNADVLRELVNLNYKDLSGFFEK